jgi:hypothetical protein
VKLLLCAGLALAAGCNSSTPAPVINSFSASPVSIVPGQSSTLAWSVSGATQIAIDNGVGVVGTASTSVRPTSTTSFTLSATSLGGSVTATVTVAVGSAVAAPTITAFTASPDSVATGGQTTLSWATTGQVTALVIDNNVGDVTGLSSKAVTVSQNTTYTLRATGPGGTVTSQVAVTTHSPFLHLQYTDPTNAAAKLLLVRNPASTGSHLILDLKVGALPVTAFGAALNIPFDPASAGMVAFNDTTASSLGGIIAGGAINVGSGPATAGAKLSGSALANVFTVGVAKHKSAAGDGDDTWAAGTTLFSIAFDLRPSAAPGTNVFQSVTLAGNPKFRAAALHKDGTEAVSRADIAVGDLVLSL